MSFSKVLSLVGAVTASSDLPDGFSYDITLDSESGLLKFDVTVPENTYFALAFGKGMIGVDMVRFVGGGDGSVEDLWSKFYGKPLTDAQNDYQNTQVVKSGGSYMFTTYRELKTSDPNGEDYQFETNEDLDMQWVVNDKTSEL